MKAEFIIFSVHHYDFEGNKGLSVRIMQEPEDSNGSFGVKLSEANVSDYNELSVLAHLGADKFPCRVSADFAMTSLKNRAGKEVTGIALKNIKYIESLQLVAKDKK